MSEKPLRRLNCRGNNSCGMRYKQPFPEDDTSFKNVGKKGAMDGIFKGHTW